MKQRWLMAFKKGRFVCGDVQTAEYSEGHGMGKEQLKLTVDVGDKYPDRITLWGRLAIENKKLGYESEIIMKGYFKPKEYNGKWYCNFNCTHIKVVKLVENTCAPSDNIDPALDLDLDFDPDEKYL